MESALVLLKKHYEVLRKKYLLPEFSKLNQEFEIEKIQERETELLLKEIRHCVSDRIASFLHFLELFLNPTMAPVFVLNAIKAISEKDKELIEKLYREFASIELFSVTLDTSYNEKKEAAFIKDTFKKWQSLKPELEKFSAFLMKISPKQEKRKSYVG